MVRSKEVRFFGMIQPVERKKILKLHGIDAKMALLSVLIQLKCSGIELVVLSVLGYQIIVVATLDNPTMLHDHDGLGIVNRGQTVGDDKDGTALHQTVSPLEQWTRFGYQWKRLLRPES